MSEQNINIEYNQFFDKLRDPGQSQVSVRAWIGIDPKTCQVGLECYMRFTPNQMGKFGRGGLAIMRRDGDNPMLTTDRFCAMTTAGGCGYNKINHMWGYLLEQLKPKITWYWGEGVFKEDDGHEDPENYYENIVERMGLKLIQVI